MGFSGIVYAISIKEWENICVDCVKPSRNGGCSIGDEWEFMGVEWEFVGLWDLNGKSR